VNISGIVWVGLAGSAGAVARLVVDGTVRGRVPSRLPVGTLAINVAGSLLLGVLTGLVVFHHVTSTLTLVAGAGFCGGFTTFSTTSFETVRLLQLGELGTAGINIGVTVVGTVAAAAVGMALASL
jgi:CrcB protein